MNHPSNASIAAGIALLGACLSTGIARANDIFTVDTTLDLIDANSADGACRTSTNTCSLRAAIMQANHATDAGITVINLPAGTYAITRDPNGGVDEEEGDLNINTPISAGQSVVLIGAGAAATIIDGNYLEGVIRISSGRTASIDGVTIRHGEDGGAFVNLGTATMSNCVVEASHATISGGGVTNMGAMEILRTTIRENVADYFGGGLIVGGPTVVRDTTIHHNGADVGGGIFVAASSDHLYIENSTISWNYATTDGGGIYNQASAFAYNISVIDNDADHDRDENGGVGGGLFADPFSRFVLVNALVARNTERDAPIADDCYGAFEAYGWNLFSDLSGCDIPNFANIGLVLPESIGPLQDNGGPTLTHALLAGSAAIDSTIDTLGCVDTSGAPLASDQRDAARIAGDRCDVGAFEYGAVAPILDSIFTDGFE
ncbi:MAG: choice-of-anchor Q domain-containing protein [Rhodanobacteraceae bacterium]